MALQTRSKHLATMVAGMTPLYGWVDLPKEGQRCGIEKKVYHVRSFGNVEVDLDGRKFDPAIGRDGTEVYWHHNVGRREGGAGGIDIHLTGGLHPGQLCGEVVVDAELRVREWHYADRNGWQNFAYVLELTPPKCGAPTFRLMVGPVPSRDTSYADGHVYVENGACVRVEPIEAPGTKPAKAIHPAFANPAPAAAPMSAGSPRFGTWGDAFRKGGGAGGRR